MGINQSKTFDLSFQDRYILAFERDDLSFNSHLVLEFTGTVNFEKLKEAFRALIINEEFCRIVPVENGEFKLVSVENVNFDLCFYELKEDELENYWQKKFDFQKEISLRMAYVQNSKIIFSCHHALFDGHAQFNFLKDFLDVYYGETYQPRTRNDVYKFRKYFLSTPISWYFKNLLPFLKIKKKKNKTQIARLADHEATSRKVDMELMELDRKIIDGAARKLGLSSSAYMSLVAAKTLNHILRERGDFDKPLVLYIPKSMRFEFKVMRAYQNLIGFIWMKLERSEIANADFANTFKNTYKFRSGEDEIKKTLFLGALIVKLKSFKGLKKILMYKEKRIHDCTMVVSSGRTPPEIKFPEEWNVNRLYAKGTMHRSPGIGLLVTSYKQKDFICIEYLRDAFEKSTIQRFKEILLKEIHS